MAKYYDRCWNPVIGCSGCFAGCDKCYAKSLMQRRGRDVGDFSRMRINKTQFHKKFDKKAQLIAVCTQSDLFQGDDGADQWVVDGVMTKCHAYRHNRYLFLTKFSRNMLRYFADDNLVWRLKKNHIEPFSFDGMAFGVTVCNQEDTSRIEDLRNCKWIGHRFVAFEPVLESISLTKDDLSGIEWVIVGAETGDNPTLCRQEWLVNIVNVADEMGIPVFVNAVHTAEGKVTMEFDEMDERLRRNDIPFGI